MAVSGFDRRTAGSQKYTERQVRNILRSLGVKVEGETWTVFLALCPFHRNVDTSSFSVNKTNGTWICFNPSCAKSGNMTGLVMQMTGRNDFEAMRFILKAQGDDKSNFVADITELLVDNEPFVEFDSELLNRLQDQIVGENPGREYMHGRGFTDRTIDRFGVGYSEKRAMVTVPVHSPDGIPVGFVGRAVLGKQFKNSTKLPTSRVLFNLHRARRESPTAIVTESSFDTMFNDQAGYPNGVGTLGGHLSPQQVTLLDKYFDKIIIATDFDELQFKDDCIKCLPDLKCHGHNPGRDLGKEIATKLSHKDIWWASYDYKVIYPNNAKDVGAITDKERAQAIENAVPNLVYAQWNLY